VYAARESGALKARANIVAKRLDVENIATL